jgi:hypothetical protein
MAFLAKQNAWTTGAVSFSAGRRVSVRADRKLGGMNRLGRGRLRKNSIEEKGWLEFLDEAKALLKGEKLIPFWRKGEERGINLRRVFTEPRTLPPRRSRLVRLLGPGSPYRSLTSN